MEGKYEKLMAAAAMTQQKADADRARWVEKNIEVDDALKILDGLVEAREKKNNELEVKMRAEMEAELEEARAALRSEFAIDRDDAMEDLHKEYRYFSHPG